MMRKKRKRKLCDVRQSRACEMGKHETYEKVLGQIGISLHSPAKPIVFNRPQGKFSADFFLFAFRGQTC